MILVDSCGWLEAIKGAGLAASHAPAFAQPDEVLVPTICVLEVARVMCRERGEQAAADTIGVMTLGTVVALDVALAAAAASLGERTGQRCGPTTSTSAASPAYASSRRRPAEDQRRQRPQLGRQCSPRRTFVHLACPGPAA